MFAMSGYRNLSVAYRPCVESIVASVVKSGGTVGVGCASGFDYFVRSAPAFGPGVGSVFRAENSVSYSLVKRSVALVQAAAASPQSGFIGWPNCPCPDKVFPSRSALKCFCGRGSGTWASAALAAGFGLPVYIFGQSALSLPQSWGEWSPSYRFGIPSFQLVRRVSQLKLF